MVYGFILLLIAGICQGSFGLGYKKYTPFSWAAFWGIYNILCLTVAVCFTWITAPSLWSVLAACGFKYLLVPLVCGAMWGLSSIGFSKGIVKIGMSMVYGISMGISTIVGSLIPMIINKAVPSGGMAVMFWVGLVLSLVGVGMVTVAGVKRDGDTRLSCSGIILAVLSGLGSGAMNVGFSFSENISNEFIRLGYSQAAVSSGKWLPVLAGGCIMCIIWCIGELCVKREWNTVYKSGNIQRTVKLFGVSMVWYAALLLYGLATVRLGDMGNTAGWILFNALALIISVGWGLKTGEWRNSKKDMLFTGCAVLIASWVFTALA